MPYIVTASHKTGLDTRSMTRRSIIVGFRGGEGQARAEARALLDNDAARPTKGSPAEVGGLTASSLPLLDGIRTSELARGKTSVLYLS